VQSLVAAALAVGAALLWAAGTVFGRVAGAELAAVHVTALRFLFGLIASVCIVQVRGAPMMFAPLTGRNVLLLVLLALIPGLLALVAYYNGLRATPATRATLAELAFPITAAAVGVGILGARLAPSQWLGFALVLTAVTALALHERRSRRPTVVVKEAETSGATT